MTVYVTVEKSYPIGMGATPETVKGLVESSYDGDAETYFKMVRYEPTAEADKFGVGCEVMVGGPKDNVLRAVDGIFNFTSADNHSLPLGE
jgi:hypothetical protein